MTKKFRIIEHEPGSFIIQERYWYLFIPVWELSIYLSFNNVDDAIKYFDDFVKRQNFKPKIIKYLP